MRTNARLGTALAAVLVLAACGGAKDSSASAESAPSGAQASPAPAGGPQTPDAGGKVVTVEMLTDEQGNNVFRPAEVTASKGDVVRYTLVSGVHNVHFVADSNAAAQGLPSAPSDMLQLPGQTYDVKVVSAPGRYFFQCDPHALLGMVGHLVVQ
ncbi:plastocyanin/azurin family copper-binding protein [Roseisolibacter agri]|uniref:Blue (type 1) copper domain-containing protein n=1 Tax=Roseisolibacter agri TaxID=2014610 RepID=A0AA37Q278_9BACT|nr:plastocyanin/azurin family copper-binding protein [Roseisolibacter agri]GLC25234.1 hypothetical protein rosag_17470 [Roseisolibacter agri]